MLLSVAMVYISPRLKLYQASGGAMRIGAVVGLCVPAMTALALTGPAPGPVATAAAQAKPPVRGDDADKTPEGGLVRRKPQTSEARPDRAHRRRGPGRGAMAVRVDRVIRGLLQASEPVIGRLVLREGGVVASRAAGGVDRILVQVGDRVRKGDVLAVLDTDIARAKLAYQKAELRLAQQELARFERLKSSNSMAFAKAKYEDAQQRVARAQANVRLAEIALRDAVIRAPYPGIVTKRNTEVGAYLGIGAPVVTMINIDSLEIEADLPADRVAGLEPGVKVRFDMRGARNLIAVVRAVIPDQNALTRTLAVRLTPSFRRADARRSVNQPVTLHVPTGAPRVAVSVHKDAVVNRGGTNLVYVVIDGKAVPRKVELGESYGSRFEVLSGLRPGELVVTRGNERLRPGQPVVVRKRS
jgi:RND family efflux transporter MFP subunit